MSSDSVIEKYVGTNELTYAIWKQALRDGYLLGQKCPECGHKTAAPKATCVRCGHREPQPVDLPTEGVVYTETTVEIAPQEFEGPYQAGIVDLGTARVMAMFETGVEIGDTVELLGTIEDDVEPGPLFG